MRTILTPTDFSKASEFAAKLANKIAKKSNSEVHLLHLIELPTGIVDMGAGSNFSVPESMLYIRKIKEKIVKFKERFFSDSLDIKYSIRFQNPYEGIRDYAKKINADLITMGSKGHTPIEEILIGSNTEKTVRNSEIPVLVTRSENEVNSLKNFVFASSFKPNKNDVFQRFFNFSKNFNCKIHLLKVNTPKKFENTYDSKKKIEDFVKRQGIEDCKIAVYNDNSVENGILNFSKEINADLVALATHGRSGLSHIFNGSITKNLSKTSNTPMLTFKV